jgi:predicted nucleotidyltransferase
MFQKLLEKIAICLKESSIDYMVIGGQALLIYGEPRLTKDVDITLGVGTDRVKDVLSLMKKSGWKVLVEEPEKFTKETMVLPCADPSTGIRMDFIFSFTDYEKQAILRAKQIAIGQEKVFFASPEDLVIQKMVAGRPRDLEDIKTVLAKNPGLDFGYIQTWLRQFEELLTQPFLERFKQICLNLHRP